jgi:hypothetical protein
VHGERTPEVEEHRAEKLKHTMKKASLAARRLAQVREFLLQIRVLEQLLKR